MRILITGGHLTAALAVIDQLKDQEIVFVGRRLTEGKDSLEYREITSRGIPFYNLTTGRFTRSLSLKTVFNLLLLPFGFLTSLYLVLKIRPARLLSFGGYLALPIAFWCWLMRIPIYTHEQTLVPGISNRVIARWSRRVFTAFEETTKYLPASKALFVGNPVRDSIGKVIKKPFTIAGNRPVIYVTGGSLGSHSINQHIIAILPELLKNYVVVHQTGDSLKYHSFENAKKFEHENYIVAKHFMNDEIGYVYSVCDLVIARAGANTFFEVLKLQKPTIFIPLPWSAHGEQKLQAQIFEKAGTGEIFDQYDSSENLLTLINKVAEDLPSYKKNFSKLSPLIKEDAAKIIVKEITQ